jgi:hypothetical protein
MTSSEQTTEPSQPNNEQECAAYQQKSSNRDIPTSAISSLPILPTAHELASWHMMAGGDTRRGMPQLQGHVARYGVRSRSRPSPARLCIPSVRTVSTVTPTRPRRARRTLRTAWPRGSWRSRNARQRNKVLQYRFQVDILHRLESHAKRANDTGRSIKQAGAGYDDAGRHSSSAATPQKRRERFPAIF